MLERAWFSFFLKVFLFFLSGFSVGVRCVRRARVSRYMTVGCPGHQLLFEHLTLERSGRDDGDDGVGGVDALLDRLRPLDADLEVPVDKNLVS